MKNIISVSRPELTTEERTKRLRAVKLAAIKLVIATETGVRGHKVTEYSERRI